MVDLAVVGLAVVRLAAVGFAVMGLAICFEHVVGFAVMVVGLAVVGILSIHKISYRVSSSKSLVDKRRFWQNGPASQHVRKETTKNKFVCMVQANVGQKCLKSNILRRSFFIGLMLVNFHLSNA